jgi:hypothetical protein
MVFVHAEGFGCVMAAFRHGIGIYSQHMTPLQALATVYGQPAIPTILLTGGPRRDFPGSAGLFLGLAEREAEREGSPVATHAAPESR